MIYIYTRDTQVKNVHNIYNYNALEINTQHHAFLPAEHVRSMAESNGKHAARWDDHLEPRRHMIAERSNEKLNLARSQKRVRLYG